jgi:hypothetical protein
MTILKYAALTILIVLALVLVLIGQASAADTGWIRLIDDSKIIRFRPDGGERSEFAVGPDPLGKQSSPDGKVVLYLKDDALYIADRSGQQQRYPHQMRCVAAVSTGASTDPPPDSTGRFRR